MYSDFPLGLICIFYNLFWIQVSLVLVCVDFLALSKGNDLFSSEKNDEFTRTLGQWIYEHMLLIFNPCFNLEFPSI